MPGPHTCSPYISLARQEPEYIQINQLTTQPLPMDLIICGGAGYALPQLSTFITSALLNTRADIAIIADSLSLEEQFCIKRFPRIKFLSIARQDKPQEFAVLRYQAFLEALNQQELSSYQMVLISDCRDVFLQTDPFKHSRELVLAAEPRSLHSCPVNRQWISDFFPDGNTFLASHGHKAVLCCGTILGQTVAVKNMLELYCSSMNRAIKRLGRIPFGLDQAMLNRLVYDEKLPGNYEIDDPHNGFALTLHYHATSLFNMYGQLVNNAGLPIPIVHQADRRPWLEQSLKSSIQFLTTSD